MFSTYSEKKEKTTSDSTPQTFVTVRQMFSADPAERIQASFQLRRSSLSPTAAAWPMLKGTDVYRSSIKRFSFSTF